MARKMQAFERRDARRQQADASRRRASLVMNIHPEAPQAFTHEAEIHRAFLLQLFGLRRFEQRQHHAAHVFRIERLAGSDGKRTVDPQHRGNARDQQNIGRIARRRHGQQLIERSSRNHARRTRLLLAGSRPVQLGDDLRELVIVVAHKNRDACEGAGVDVMFPLSGSMPAG